MNSVDFLALIGYNTVNDIYRICLEREIPMKINMNLVYDVREITTIKELLESSCSLFEERPAFLVSDPEGVKEITYGTLYNETVALATYLRSILPEGCKIAVTGRNSYNWALSYLAVTCGVGVVVPIDKDLRGDEISALLADSESAAVIYDEAMEEKLEGVSCLKLNMANIGQYVSEGSVMVENGNDDYKNHKIDPHALGALLYTSGTTGVAKGVMLSQYNICFDITHILKRVEIFPPDVALSVAPLHHTYESTVGFLLILYSGASIAHNSSLKRLQSELKLYRPTIMAVVPLILDTFRKAIIKKYNKIKGGRFILGLQKAASDLTGNKAGKKIFSLINETFGGRLRMMVCGAALLPPEVFRDYERFGIKILIGYGLTETAPVSVMHDDSYSAPDDIGRPVSGVKVKLDDVNEEGIGELLVKGPNVMLGYYKNPEETARVMTEDGYFRTGDLATLTEKGTYRITGRAKSMIVSPGGKKIFPEELELFLEKSEYVKEALVYEENSEEGRRISVAIIPEEDAIDRKILKNGVEKGESEYLALEKEILTGVVKDVNSKFPNYKHICKVYVRKRDFVKTTTRKIKRNERDNLENED